MMSCGGAPALPESMPFPSRGPGRRTLRVERLERRAVTGTLNPEAAGAAIRLKAADRLELDGIRVTDTRGRFIAGRGVDRKAPIDFSDRSWFIVHRDRPDAGLFMSEPLISKLAGLQISSFSRRYNSPGGVFAGVVSASVPLSYFVRQLQAVDAGPHGIVTLRDAQLRLIARHPEPPADGTDTAGSRKVSAALAALVESGRPSGTYRTVCPVDGTERSFAFRRLLVAPAPPRPWPTRC
jgi:hypothetical protein